MNDITLNEPGPSRQWGWDQLSLRDNEVDEQHSGTMVNIVYTAKPSVWLLSEEHKKVCEQV